MTPKTKHIGSGVAVDEERRVLVIATIPAGTCGIFRAPAVRNGETIADEWHVYLETNGDPAMIPHPTDEEALSEWLSDAGVSREEFDAAIGNIEWYS